MKNGGQWNGADNNCGVVYGGNGLWRVAIRIRHQPVPLSLGKHLEGTNWPQTIVSLAMASSIHFVTFSTMAFFIATSTVKGILLPWDVLLQRLSAEENAKLSRECGHSTAGMPGGREHPWAVSFMTKGRNKLGGTIISPFHILTVAHGFIRFDNSASGACEVSGYRHFGNLRSTWTVVYGSDCIRAQSDDPVCARPNITLNRIRAIYVDEVFAEGRCIEGHDWAIVEVEERIHFSNRVQPICLPLQNRQQIPDGQVLTVMSWGRRDAFHKGDILIREIPMRNDAECRARPWADQMPTGIDDYLCAKALNPRDFNTPRTCHGDSGSGMEWRRRIPSTAPTRIFRELPSGMNETTIAKEGGNRTNKLGKEHATKQILHSPLAIPELEFMRKWPTRMRAAKRQTTGGGKPIAIRGEGDEIVVKLLDDSMTMGGGEMAEEQQWQCELVAVTSYGSRQCASDELARFTRISKYLEKICSLTGICYPLESRATG